MKRGVFALMTLVVSSLGGCATIVAEASDLVLISSEPPGASVSVVNEDGREVWRGTTPSTALLPAGAGYFDGQTYTMTATLDGYEPTLVTLDTNLCNWYWGNFVFGWGIGLLIVDPLSGGMWDLPEEAPTIQLTRSVAAPPVQATPPEP